MKRSYRNIQKRKTRQLSLEFLPQDQKRFRDITAWCGTLPKSSDRKSPSWRQEQLLSTMIYPSWWRFPLESLLTKTHVGYWGEQFVTHTVVFIASQPDQTWDSEELEGLEDMYHDQTFHPVGPPCLSFALVYLRWSKSEAKMSREFAYPSMASRLWYMKRHKAQLGIVHWTQTAEAVSDTCT